MAQGLTVAAVVAGGWAVAGWILGTVGGVIALAVYGVYYFVLMSR